MHSLPAAKAAIQTLFTMAHFNRRKFIATGAMAGAGAVTVPAGFADNKGQIVHHVYFWLKNPDSMEDRAKLVEGVKSLGKIEVVKEIRVGILAKTEKRDVVDQSWQVSELMFFKNVADQATYQNHPIHLEFIKNYSMLWSKVIVYDMEVV
jgi:hypothetical protein